MNKLAQHMFKWAKEIAEEEDNEIYIIIQFLPAAILTLVGTAIGGFPALAVILLISCWGVFAAIGLWFYYELTAKEPLVQHKWNDPRRIYLKEFITTFTYPGIGAIIYKGISTYCRETLKPKLQEIREQMDEHRENQ